MSTYPTFLIKASDQVIQTFLTSTQSLSVSFACPDRRQEVTHDRPAPLTETGVGTWRKGSFRKLNRCVLSSDKLVRLGEREDGCKGEDD